MLIDKKYLSLISSKFGLVDKGNHRVCRCPICGDSKQNKHKMRGYFITNDKKKRIQYFCHNCDASMLLSTFLKLYVPSLYPEYKKERAFDGIVTKKKAPKTDEKAVLDKLQYNIPSKNKNALETPTTSEFKINKRVLQHLTPIMQAPMHVQMYLYNRKIPSDIAKKYFYYTDTFMAYTNLHERGKFSDGAVAAFDEPRIVILMYNEEGKCIGFQGRCLPGSDAQAKYITIKLDVDEEGKCWGKDRLDKSKPVVVVEGPIDACFINNGVAVCGADLVSQSSYIDGVSEFVYFFDNEPRSQQIVKKMRKAINGGKKVVILPKSIKQKDVNDLVLAGYDVNSLIYKHTYKGLRARNELIKWSKIK